MSKETEPIRSRRQLREQSAHRTGAPGVPAAPARTVPVSPLSPDEAPAPETTAAETAAAENTVPEVAVPETAMPETAVPETAMPETAAPKERQSQTRARDRAALRAYKELVDPPGLSPLPSRKALRQAQLDAERAPITAVNPVVSANPLPRSTGAIPLAQPHQPPASVPKDTDVSGVPGTGTENVASEADAAEAGLPASAATPAAATPSTQAPAATPAAPALRARGGRRAAPVPNDQASASGRFGTGPVTRVDTQQTEPSADVPATSEAPHEGQTSSSHNAPNIPKPPTPPTSAPGTAAGPTISEPAVENSAPENSTLENSGTAGTAEAQIQDAEVHETAADAVAVAPSVVAKDSTVDGQDSVTESVSNYSPMPGLVPGGAYYPVTAGPPIAPSPEELELLAAKRAEAERAAVLAQRAQARERLAQESAKNRRPQADPTATNNLAMVTPMEFMDVPGMGQPVMRPPSTTHVPIVTRATPRQVPAVRKAPRDSDAATTAPSSTVPSSTVPSSGEPNTTVPNVSAERFDAALAARAVHRPGPGNRPLTGGRSSTLKRAEAMAAVDHAATTGQTPVQPRPAATAAVPVQRSQMPPMPADYAHGLEPLDAMTAGLGRTQRNLLIQWGSIIVGGAAFVAGAIMVLTNILH